MFLQCRNTLKDSLIAAGAKTKSVYTSRKKLSLCNESRVFAVLSEDDILRKDRSKRIYTDNSGRHKRRKKYCREASFNVVIGEYDIEKVEGLYNAFLDKLPEGIFVEGNYVDIEPTAAEWFDDEDTILKAKCAVQVKITCKGGVYKDTDFAKTSDVEITVKKEE